MIEIDIACNGCKAPLGDRDDVHCADCMKALETVEIETRKKLEEAICERDEFESLYIDAQEKLELEAKVYAEEVAQWRERVRLLEERLRAA